MHQTPCGKYGFNKSGREARLALLEMTAEDDVLAQRLLHEVILPNINTIGEAFYQFIGRYSEMTKFIKGPQMLQKLKQTQMGYLASLGDDFRSEAYFNNRLRVGIAHARISLPLSYYFAAYRKLVELIIMAFPPQIAADGLLSRQLGCYVNRIVSLDMTLALDVYHISKVQELVASVDHLLDEKHNLTSQVQHDSLTRLTSRQYLLDVLSREISRVKREQLPLTIAMADLDEFKKINDTLGHLVGDRVLLEVAHRSLTSVRDRDMIGRYGGEEFLMVFPDTRMAVACRVAERIRSHIAATPVHLGDLSVPVTVSIGVAEYIDGEGRDSFIQRADDAMYAAKHAGRNRISCH